MGAYFWKGKGEKKQTSNVKCFTFRKLVKASAEKKTQEELRISILHKISYPLDQLLYMKLMKSLRREETA